MRKSGILMPVFSLPSDWGIGCFSKEAEEFVDFLVRSGQSYWQLLPLSPTAYGDSPYQSPSAFAGNPYFIDIAALCREGLLTEDEAESYRKLCSTRSRVDYNFLYTTRGDILSKAFSRFDTRSPDYISFKDTESYWLGDYALFMAIKETLGGAPLKDWPGKLKHAHNGATADFDVDTIRRAEFHKFVQYQFMKQWLGIKKYANSKGIQIIGDIPIYVAADSADLWSHSGLFELGGDLNPITVAGCPPDRFDKRGQLWGNPIYDWEQHSKDGNRWWIERIKRNMRLYDVIRLDHFRGFESFYSVPADSETAEIGEWRKGPGIELFNAIKKGCPHAKFIAEDLGFITDSVRKLLADTGFAGMKILQFAFEDAEDNVYLPHNYTTNNVVYTGTHDNHTAAGWATAAPPSAVKRMAEYVNTPLSCKEDVCRSLVHLAMTSVADTCIIPFYDYLERGDEYRINIPGKVGGHWTVRFDREDFSGVLVRRIWHLTKLSGRLKHTGVEPRMVLK